MGIAIFGICGITIGYAVPVETGFKPVSTGNTKPVSTGNTKPVSTGQCNNPRLYAYHDITNRKPGISIYLGRDCFPLS